MEEWESDLEDGEEGGFLKERLKEARKGLQMGSGGGKGGGCCDGSSPPPLVTDR